MSTEPTVYEQFRETYQSDRANTRRMLRSLVWIAVLGLAMLAVGEWVL